MCVEKILIIIYSIPLVITRDKLTRTQIPRFIIITITIIIIIILETTFDEHCVTLIRETVQVALSVS